MNRGARREPIFPDAPARELFLKLLAELPERFGVRVHGYALMSNHYHLLVETPRANLSRAMQHLGAQFTGLRNRHYPDWDGPLFRGRFKNRLVEEEAYWLHLLAYVHLNPVVAGLASSLDTSRWTSHRAYVGLEPRPPWLHIDELMDLFGGVEAYREYAAEMLQGHETGPEGFDPDELWTPAPTAGLPQPRPEPAPVMEALSAVCAVTGVGRAALTVSARGATGNPARWLAAWWLERAAGLTHREIGRILGASPVLVSRWIRAIPQSPRAELRRWQLALSPKGAAFMVES